jgi:hypothetical protein
VFSLQMLGLVQVPQLTVPPQPSEIDPQTCAAPHDVIGTHAGCATVYDMLPHKGAFASGPIPVPPLETGYPE